MAIRTLQQVIDRIRVPQTLHSRAWYGPWTRARFRPLCSILLILIILRIARRYIWTDKVKAARQVSCSIELASYYKVI